HSPAASACCCFCCASTAAGTTIHASTAAATRQTMSVILLPRREFGAAKDVAEHRRAIGRSRTGKGCAVGRQEPRDDQARRDGVHRDLHGIVISRRCTLVLPGLRHL